MALDKKTHGPLIAPSLLAADLTSLKEEVQKIEAAGADILHFDVMDGHFVPNLTFGLPVIRALKKITKLPVDAHLMITNADSEAEKYLDAGCDMLSIHVEACPHLHRTLQLIRGRGAKAGVAINPGTSLSHLDSALDHCDFVLIMSVNPGFGGQGFIPESISRIEKVASKIGNRPVRIEVDGGIKVDNAAKIAQAGAEILVVGTGLFGTPDYAETLRQLRKPVS